MDLRGPVRFLWWLARQQPRRIALVALHGSVWVATMALTPHLSSEAVDRGPSPQRAGPLTGWAVAVLALGMVNGTAGILRHRTMAKTVLSRSVLRCWR